MPVVQVEAQLTPSDLLRAVEQLEVQDLDEFTRSVIALRAARVARPARDESALLEAAREAPESEVRRRVEQLIGRRQDERLTPEEHEELVRLTADMEALDVRRIEALAELAEVRGMTLRDVMQEFGLDASRGA
jgi:hypothetical protein